ncbi:MAG: CBS domain-containing protein [Planctomycetota bacterium]|nr:MAG: CBS domain-containing protein [Planctomycetota bacterium]REJ95037.1 MAG: CBS domain-containing protein [Planctomycetota bacterium]REK25260.1 MAG: CBS domain-containing protein [Planctomycetota bacterium]REK40581.1 MAG: CBS domain-containing protein [Planctomycetota bacterium]
MENRIDMKKVELSEALNQLRNASGGDSLLVAQVMTQDPICISDNTTALDLAKMFHSKRFRHLLVCDGGGRLVGLVSDRDLIGCFSPLDPPTQEQLAQIATSVLMSTDLLTVQPDSTIIHAVNLMLKHGINSLPVIEEGRLRGIVTTTDLKILLQVFLERAELERAKSDESARAAEAVTAN